MWGMSWIPASWRRRLRPAPASLPAAVLEHFPGVVVRVDEDGVVLEASRGAEARLGHVARALIGQRLVGLDEDPLRGELARGLAVSRTEAMPWRGLVRCRLADGRLRYQDVSIQPLAMDEAPPQWLVLLLDVDDLVAPARAEQARLRRLEATLDGVPGAVFRWRQTPRGEWAFDYLSAGVRDLCGLSAETLMARPDRFFALVAEADHEGLIASLAQSSVGLSPWSRVFRLSLPGGERWLEGQAGVRRAARGETVWEGWLQDVTRRREEEARTQALIMTDMLTGLLNRRGFRSNGHAVLAHATRHRRRVAVAMLDLDHFKALNDTHGHAAGDIALQTFARIGRDCLRPYDLMARIGGEEFAVLLSDSDPDEAREVFERLRETVAATELSLGERILHVTVSLGMAIVEPGGDLDEALNRADRALYRAKHEGRNRLLGPLDE